MSRDDYITITYFFSFVRYWNTHFESQITQTREPDWKCSQSIMFKKGRVHSVFRISLTLTHLRYGTFTLFWRHIRKRTFYPQIISLTSTTQSFLNERSRSTVLRTSQFVNVVIIIVSSKMFSQSVSGAMSFIIIFTLERL